MSCIYRMRFNMVRQVYLMEINFQYIFITAPINLVPFTDNVF